VTNAASGAGASLLPNRVGSTRYLVMQNIPWFGKRDLRRDVAQSAVDEAKGKADATWADLAARIKTAYARYHQVTQSVRLFREIVDLLDRLERIAQVRYAGGLTPQQDVIRAQTERTAAQTELVVMESEVIGMQAMLNSLVNRPANAALAEPQRLRQLPAPAALEFLIVAEQAQARNPELFADEARIRGAEKNRALVHANRYPDFTVGISPVQMRDRFSEWELMLEINIPLQQKARRHQEREAETTLSAARARRDATINRVLGELGRALAALEAARRTEILTSTSLLPQAELTFQAALVAYETGRADFATLLDAQRQIRQAKLIRIRAQAEAQTRLSEIERFVGEKL
jgi:outer membrane protein, heavy metal efflux system